MFGSSILVYNNILGIQGNEELVRNHALLMLHTETLFTDDETTRVVNHLVNLRDLPRGMSYKINTHHIL